MRQVLRRENEKPINSNIEYIVDYDLRDMVDLHVGVEVQGGYKYFEVNLESTENIMYCRETGEREGATLHDFWTFDAYDAKIFIFDNFFELYSWVGGSNQGLRNNYDDLYKENERIKKLLETQDRNVERLCEELSDLGNVNEELSKANEDLSEELDNALSPDVIASYSEEKDLEIQVLKNKLTKILRNSFDEKMAKVPWLLVTSYINDSDGVGVTIGGEMVYKPTSEQVQDFVKLTHDNVVETGTVHCGKIFEIGEDYIKVNMEF